MAFPCSSLIKPCSRALVVGGTGIVGSGVVQALLKQGAKVSVGTRCMDNFNALFELTPAHMRCNLSAAVGDLRTEEGAKAVFDQATGDCAGVQHVFAALRGNKTTWECGRMWDQSLKDFYVGSREEVTGHFLLMKAILPYLENITGSTYTVLSGYPGNACPAPGTPSSLPCLSFGTLCGLATAARAEHRKSKVSVSEVHLKCIVLKQLDCDICGLGNQHLGNDLIGSVVTAVAGCGLRMAVVIHGRDDAKLWTTTDKDQGQFPRPPSCLPPRPPPPRPACGPCR